MRQQQPRIMFNIRLPKDLHDFIKQQSIENYIPMCQVITDLIVLKKKSLDKK